MPSEQLRGLAAHAFRLRRKVFLSIKVEDLRDCTPKVPVVYRLGGVEDLTRFSDCFYGTYEDSNQYSLERLKAGDWLVLGELNGEVVFAGWVMFGKIDMGVRDLFDVDSDCVAAYRLFTRPDLRGNKLGPAYFAFLRSKLYARGIRRMVAWRELRNAESRKLKIGFTHIGIVWHLRILRRSFFWMPASVVASLRSG
jgi:GNAT superfamily N-acetyltransferase